MKVVALLLLLAGLASCQHNHFGQSIFPTPPSGRTSHRSFNKFGGISGGQSFGLSGRGGRTGVVHASNGGSDYHFSWKATEDTFKGKRVRSYCNGLGRGWEPVGISTQNEINFIREVLTREHNLKYFWTGGTKVRGEWKWANGEPFNVDDWSRTGANHQRQPDNRENPEECLGVLKEVYRDGIVWHDVNCRFKKAVVCERRQQ